MSASAQRSPANLHDAATDARSAYAAILAADGTAATPWWDHVILTTGSESEARHFAGEIRNRRESGRLPRTVSIHIVHDIGDTPMGSGGATLNALRVLAAESHAALDLDWWAHHRVLIVHCGGSSGRAPEISISGRFFTTLPLATSSGAPTTLFDETMALSTAWARALPFGLLVASGDVIVTFDAADLDWSRSGVTGVAMSQPAALSAHHGVYLVGTGGRVYSFLQKASTAEIAAGGGLLDHDSVALDIGLLRFDPLAAVRLSHVAGELTTAAQPPRIDLYRHITFALTGQWKAAPADHPVLQSLSAALDGLPFWCCLVRGSFTHLGDTRSFRRVLAESGALAQLDAPSSLIVLDRPSTGLEAQVVDSVLTGPHHLETGSIVIECDLEVPVHAGPGAILRGLQQLGEPVEIPANTIVEQAPVELPDGRQTWVLRVYGVTDDPQLPIHLPEATWLGEPVTAAAASRGLDPEALWPGIPAAQRSLWNAVLFPCGSPQLVWDAARWLLGAPSPFTLAEWAAADRLSLATSSQYLNHRAAVEIRRHRAQSSWQATAVSLALDGADIRPLLAHSPSIPALAATGRAILTEASTRTRTAPTQAASLNFQASLLLARSGLLRDAETAQSRAFSLVRNAVDQLAADDFFCSAALTFQRDSVTVSAPPRIDFGGGWSDTPPFCLDWGGTVLNLAIELDGRYPISTRIRRLAEPVLRCLAGASRKEFPLSEPLPPHLPPGSPFAIHIAVARLTGLQPILARESCGLEISTAVDLPMGSGLGTSSILAAATLRAVATLFGLPLADSDLVAQVTRLEQLMTTGGGWQDQAGGIFPGAKLLLSGPGLLQRVRVEPVAWSPACQAALQERLVLYDTGLQRIAKGLLRQVVGRYLARETSAVQVLHSIKTLALEMAHALREADWPHLGELLNRHWQLNQVLDPNTTNAPINALLRQVRPLILGAKLAGAGGGGFMMLLAPDPDAAARLRQCLSTQTDGLPGRVCEVAIATDGLRIS